MTTPWRGGGATGRPLRRVGIPRDRLRSPQGVVDFMDVGVGGMRFHTFDVADTCMSGGAVLMAIMLSRADDTRPSAEPEPGRT